MAAKTRFTKWSPVFLRVLAANGSVRAACAAARVSPRTVYRWRESSVKFAADWEAALSDAGSRLKETAWTRALTGVSDTLLLHLLREEEVRSGIKTKGENREAFEATFRAIQEAGKYDEADAARVQMCRSLADAVDRNTGNAQLWGKYQDALNQLTAAYDVIRQELDKDLQEIRGASALGYD